MSHGNDHRPVPQSSLDELDPRELLNIIMRNKFVIAGLCALAVVLAVAIALSIPPTYRAAAQVHIQTPEPTSVNNPDVRAELRTSEETILSEIEVIRSRYVIQKVITELDLLNDPRFTDPAPSHWLETLTSALGSLVGGTEEEEVKSAADLVESIQSSVSVSQVGLSHVIAIGYEARDPELAATMANAIAQLYIEARLEQQFDVVKQASAWMSGHISDLEDKVRASERAVEEYRVQSGLIDADGTDLLSQQLSELSSKLLTIRAERAAAESRLSEVRAGNLDEGRLEIIAPAVGSNILEKLRLTEAELERQIVDLSSDFGERHPEMIKARAELADLQKRIERELNKIVAGMENQVRVARLQEAAVEESIEKLREEVEAANAKRVELRALEREATANRMLLENFLATAKQTSLQSDPASRRAHARVISAASVPEFPAAPRKRMIVAGGLAIGLFFGLLASFVIEYFRRDVIRSAADVETATGLPVFSVIPRSSCKHRLGPAATMIDAPVSHYADAIRNLQTRLRFASRATGDNTLVVTSTHSDEGKSTVALSLALAYARSGQRTILIEADLRQPTLQNVLKLPQKAGLFNYLTGEGTAATVRHVHVYPRLDVIAAGATTSDTQWLLGSEAMRQLLEHLSVAYDMVVIDAPPVLPVADAPLLAKLCGRALLIVKWSTIPRKALHRAVAMLKEFEVDVLGVVLNQIDPKTYGLYGYDYVPYYGADPKEAQEGEVRKPKMLATQEKGQSKKGLAADTSG
jgi:succinoglycan biosynthesis transport protein ExoP